MKLVSKNSEEVSVGGGGGGGNAGYGRTARMQVQAERQGCESKRRHWQALHAEASYPAFPCSWISRRSSERGVSEDSFPGSGIQVPANFFISCASSSSQLLF